MTNPVTAAVSQESQSYTELQDGMHYLADGSWIESQDVIELTPTGAQAVRGPLAATFGPDITSRGAIALTAPAGDVFRSHPLGLFFADSASGKVARIGAVQLSQGTLYWPNVVVFSNVLAGINADLMLVWAKNGFEQNLVLKQCPARPEAFGLASATTTLQLWSSMDTCPVPLEQRPVLLPSGLQDHILIFNDAWFPVGAAFALGDIPLPPQGQAAAVRLIKPSEPGSVPVAKSLVSISGQTVLIEEIRYLDLAGALSQLPQAGVLPSQTNTVQLADRAMFLEPDLQPISQGRHMQVASAQYSPKGVVIDYSELSGGASSYTFSNGNTYHVLNTFSVGPGIATFQQNSCLKFENNGYLLAYAGVSCSSSGTPTVFTAKDDNSYGATISGSTANPSYAAAQALWMYYQSVPTTLQNLKVRWSQTGIRYDAQYLNQPHLNSSSFQNCNTGVRLSIGGDNFYLSQDTYCNVATPLYDASDGATHIYGNITLDCGVVSVAMVNDPNRDTTGLDPSKNSQSECSFVLPDNSTVVAAFWNTHLSEYGLGTLSYAFPGISSPRSVSWAKSVNSGASFTDMGPIPPTSPSATQGDAGDPVMAYAPGMGGPNGTIYLLVNASREGTLNGFRLWTSTDKGATFSLVNNDVPSNSAVITADKPMMKLNGADIYVAGKSSGANTIWAAHSGNGGSSWDRFRVLDTAYPSNGTDIEFLGGNAYVFWLQGASGSPYVNRLRYAWTTSGGSWSTSRNFGITLNSAGTFGSGQLLRSRSADPSDYFDSNGFPRIAAANGRMYVVYADLPYPGSTADRGDIWITEATLNADGSLSITATRRVNNDGTSTDQWNPSIAVSGTKLFIGYYSRQNDSNNSLIMAYGAKADIASGLAGATFDCFPIGPTAFSPLFAGTTAQALGGWAYDPVWPQAGVCLDTNAKYAGVGSPLECLNISTGGTYVNFCADDYTWAGADASYFYFSWCDRSRSFGVPPNARGDADVKFAKIRQ